MNISISMYKLMFWVNIVLMLNYEVSFISRRGYNFFIINLDWFIYIETLVNWVKLDPPKQQKEVIMKKDLVSVELFV